MRIRTIKADSFAVLVEDNLNLRWAREWLEIEESVRTGAVCDVYELASLPDRQGPHLVYSRRQLWVFPEGDVFLLLSGGTRAIVAVQELEDLLNAGRIVRFPPNGATVRLDCATFKVTDVESSWSAAAFLLDIADVQCQLRGVPPSLHRCEDAALAYAREPTVDAFDRLRVAYATIPPPLRRYLHLNHALRVLMEARNEAEVQAAFLRLRRSINPESLDGTNE